MAGNMKEIKQRIRSVESTRQITKAMELVASSKLRHAQDRAFSARPRFEELQSVMHKLAAESADAKTVYTVERDSLPTLAVVIAGDRGLAGGYNSNIFKLAEEKLSENDWVVPIGVKACEHFARRPYKVYEQYADIAETLTYGQAGELADLLLEPYQKSEVGRILILYTQCKSALAQIPKVATLFPLVAEKHEGATVLTEYDPSPEAVFASVAPLYMSWTLYGAIAESFAAEQAARRTAMDTASENATEMIDELSLRYNRARQDAITQEITELVSGSAAAGN